MTLPSIQRSRSWPATCSMQTPANRSSNWLTVSASKRAAAVCAGELMIATSRIGQLAGYPFNG
ncbi:MAG: hypothetical protein ING58_05815 [Rhodocyclaceae bacterium]|nr:hypothetical protein [Rhodocyclaceae bacterium]